MLSEEATMYITQQQMFSLLLKLCSENWLSSTHNPSGHKGLFEWSPQVESQGPLGPALGGPTSVPVRAGSHAGGPSPHLLASEGRSLWIHAGLGGCKASRVQSKPGACSPEPSCCLRPLLALAIRDELLAGTGDTSRQLFVISSRVRQ